LRSPAACRAAGEEPVGRARGSRALSAISRYMSAGPARETACGPFLWSCQSRALAVEAQRPGKQGPDDVDEPERGARRRACCATGLKAQRAAARPAQPGYAFVLFACLRGRRIRTV